MRVNGDRQAGRARDRGHQAASIDRSQDAGDVLDPDPVHAHGLQAAGGLDHARLIRGRTRAVDESADHPGTGFAGNLDRNLEVAQVVERVEHLDHANAVFDGLLDEGAHHVIRLMGLSEQCLSADQHLQWRLDDGGSHRAQPLPRIFLQGPHLRGERPTTPGVEGVVADIVESFGDRQHVLQLEPSLHQTLLRVAQHGLGDQDLGHRRYCMPGF